MRSNCLFKLNLCRQLNRQRIFYVLNGTQSIGCRYLATSTWTPFHLTDTLTLDVKKSIEKKWGENVYGVACPAELNNERTDFVSSGKNYYILSMFPYPSGQLHLGHARVYTLSDVLARFNRLRGHKVIHPMGWDAFGLPAENAARDHGIEPEKWTRENIQNMKDQMIRMGCCFDWDSELATCDPSYYKWTQWLFIKLYENGLAYRKQAYVFWDPVDKTVLAEEQVDSEMRSWRSGAKVEKKLLRQWFIRTTYFAKELSDSLDTDILKQGWREIKIMQKNWIGPMKGYFSDCECILPDTHTLVEPLRLWFSSPDQLKDAEFVILKPDHYLVTNSDKNVLRIFENGVKQMNFFIRIPTTGKHLPVFTSTTMDIPLVPESSDCRLDECLGEDIFGDIAINEHHMEEIKSVLSLSEVPPLFTDEKVGDNYHPASLRLRDWLVSRQRNWGTPIPALNCLDCEHTEMVSVSELPLTKTSNHSQSKCSNCGSKYLKKETDTLDTFFDSTWYYLRFLDSKNNSNIFNPKSIEPFLPVNIYIGGAEHATLHLYYARFMSHFLNRIGLIPVKETFKRLIPIGVVKGETYVLNKSGKYINQDQLEETVIDGKKKLAEKQTGLLVTKKWEKMSKSKYNGVDPDLIIEQYGIDTARLLSMAEAVPTSPRKWSTDNFNGFLKFQHKVWITVQEFVEGKENEEIHVTDESEWVKVEHEIFDARNYYLKGIMYNYAKTNQVSVVISKLQGLVGSIRKIENINYKESIQLERTLGTLLISLYPIMPAFSAQLWQYFRDVANLTEKEFDLDNEVWCQRWPEVDQNYNLDLIVQLNSIDKCKIKIERHILDTLDLNVAIELVLEEPELSKQITRDTLNVISFNIQPSYRAVINLCKNNSSSSLLSIMSKSNK